MRMIGQLPGETDAANFGDFLKLQGISTEMEVNPDGTRLVWVLEEEGVDRATGFLKEYLANPGDPKFLGNAKKARALKESERRQVREMEERVKTREDLMPATGSYGLGPLSGFLILICAAVFLLSEEGNRREVTRQFFIGFSEIYTGQPLTEIRQGEFWRLFTPALLHFGWAHLICNMLWVYSLGSMIEARRGTGFLCTFVVLTSIIPNLAQYWFYHNPFFGGMSGVTFALAGYAWQRGRVDPGSGIGLDQTTVIMLVIYFLLCWMQELNVPLGFSLFGGAQRVANVVHTVGLAMGAAWGYWDGRRMVR